ncbi:YiiX/YebB-like N1pC/P60 family cysteine hydrolase [Bdellovibrio sp. NC01]|uniref:YiiX/YebB-like N1pC/P60 family cysteine hydrolase n=1 Tax=Bdellovibrio sp. NC01 TaxID=2220073 RepID=UPI001157CBC6|nr:YiiX/YebB-like N1pC/P60 family cysteine hydrolase [Bdellovibrio sp. NC01]QDK38459.1 hypothetical protein DOE51_13170 [Bdellovibrio sp. NC01]
MAAKILIILLSLVVTVAHAEVALVEGVQKVTKDLNDPKIFNVKTCPTYIDSVTEYLFRQPADHFVPKTPQDIQYFKNHGIEILKSIFAVRVRLHDVLDSFANSGELSKECVLKIREGIQYARFTEEYVLEWLMHEKVYSFTEAPILAGEEPFVLRNPKFSEVKLQAGDVMLIRGKSYVSAMIARIGDEEGNFSHAAIVAQDEKGALYVVEALIQYGVVVTPLEQWRKTQDARVALYRFRDPAIAIAAAKAAYPWGLQHLDYDFAMDDSDYSKAFCSEVVKYAYDKGSNGKVILPAYRSTVSKFKGGDYPKSLGVTSSTLFAPYDIEVDPRFEFVAEGKYYPLLRQVRMQDAVLQSVYGWMIDKNYTFYPNASITAQVYIGKFLRYLGFFKDQFPTYMPIETMKSVFMFEKVADPLEENLYKKEDEYYKAKNYLPSFLEMMQANDKYREQDLERYKQGESPKFHKIFRPSNVQ